MFFGRSFCSEKEISFEYEDGKLVKIFDTREWSDEYSQLEM